MERRFEFWPVSLQWSRQSDLVGIIVYRFCRFTRWPKGIHLIWNRRQLSWFNKGPGIGSTPYWRFLSYAWINVQEQALQGFNHKGLHWTHWWRNWNAVFSLDSGDMQGFRLHCLQGNRRYPCRVERGFQDEFSWCHSSPKKSSWIFKHDNFKT